MPYYCNPPCSPDPADGSCPIFPQLAFPDVRAPSASSPARSRQTATSEYQTRHIIGDMTPRFSSTPSFRRRLATPSRRALLTSLWIFVFTSLFMWQLGSVNHAIGGALFPWQEHKRRPVPLLRPIAFNLTDFGGVGDGTTSNTLAFERAIKEIAKFRKMGGGQLNIGKGVWLTAPFNLTSHMTLFLEEGSVILAIDDEKQWPLMPPLPSYGHGREHDGPRYGSFIHGQNLSDIIITGHNGTINGQGKDWWSKHRLKMLKHTRGPLVQLMWSRDVVISGITLRDSPFWTLHPYDCKNVTISNLTILAPLYGAPNTDGIDPDSCEDLIIENCYICVGDDGIAIKSGWDQYGITYGHPSTNIVVRNTIIRSMISAGVSIGSEMSGGVSNVTVENVIVWDSKRAVRMKTALGRGGYISNILYRNLTFDNVRIGIIIKTNYNEHADQYFDPKAVPKLNNLTFIGIYGRGVRVPVRIEGSKDIPVRGVSFQKMKVGLSYKKKHIFQCSYVEGRTVGHVFPKPCKDLDKYNEKGQLLKRGIPSNIIQVDDDL